MTWTLIVIVVVSVVVLFTRWAFVWWQWREADRAFEWRIRHRKDLHKLPEYD